MGVLSAGDYLSSANYTYLYDISASFTSRGEEPRASGMLARASRLRLRASADAYLRLASR